MRKHMGSACACQSEQTWLEASLEETLIVQTEGCSNEKNEKKSLFKYDIKKKHNKSPLNAKEILEELEQNESFQVKK